MSILNYILLAAIVVFALAMLFICIGLFMGSRKGGSQEEATAASADVPASDAADTAEIPETDDEERDDSDEESDAEDRGKQDDSSEDADAKSEEDKADEDAGDGDDTDKPDAEARAARAAKAAAAKETGSGKAQSGSDIPPGEKGLRLVSTDGKESYFAKIASEITIGRSKDCDIVIPHQMISGLHCIVYKVGSKLLIEDNNSTNGTLINGKKLEHQLEIKNNDVVTMADKSYKISI